MSNLKNVRAELEKMKKDMAAKEAELKREEARPIIEIINDALLNSETVQEKMSAYNKDEQPMAICGWTVIKKMWYL